MGLNAISDCPVIIGPTRQVVPLIEVNFDWIGGFCCGLYDFLHVANVPLYLHLWENNVHADQVRIEIVHAKQ